MLETLDRGTLRGLRDRAMLLWASPAACAAPRSSASTSARDQTEDGRGWVEILDKGMLVTLRGKTGWREVEIGRGSSDATCPVVALETWLRFARIAHGPLFRRVTGQGKTVGADRLERSGGCPAGQAHGPGRRRARRSLRGRAGREVSGHSLRAGLASSAEVDERYVQKQLRHASAEMTPGLPAAARPLPGQSHKGSGL